jgi:hypothetical protein
MRLLSSRSPPTAGARSLRGRSPRLRPGAHAHGAILLCVAFCGAKAGAATRRCGKGCARRASRLCRALAQGPQEDLMRQKAAFLSRNFIAQRASATGFGSVSGRNRGASGQNRGGHRWRVPCRLPLAAIEPDTEVEEEKRGADSRIVLRICVTSNTAETRKFGRVIACAAGYGRRPIASSSHRFDFPSLRMIPACTDHDPCPKVQWSLEMKRQGWLMSVCAALLR